MDNIMVAFDADAEQNKEAYSSGQRGGVYAIATLSPDKDTPLEIMHGANGVPTLLFLSIARLILGIKQELDMTTGEVIGKVLDTLIRVEADTTPAEDSVSIEAVE